MNLDTLVRLVSPEEQIDSDTALGAATQAGLDKTFQLLFGEFLVEHEGTLRYPGAHALRANHPIQYWPQTKGGGFSAHVAWRFEWGDAAFPQKSYPLTLRLDPVLVHDNRINILLGERDDLPDYASEENPYSWFRMRDMSRPFRGEVDPARRARTRPGMVLRWGSEDEGNQVDFEIENGPQELLKVSASGARFNDGTFVQDDAARKDMRPIPLDPYTVLRRDDTWAYSGEGGGTGETDLGPQERREDAWNLLRVSAVSGGVPVQNPIPGEAFEGLGKTVWALKLDSQGAQYDGAFGQRVKLDATWLMRWDPLVTPFYVMVDADGAQWDVVAVREIGRRRHMQVDVTRDIGDPRRFAL